MQRFPFVLRTGKKILEIAGAGCASAVVAFLLGGPHEQPSSAATNTNTPAVVRLAPADEEMIRAVRSEKVPRTAVSGRYVFLALSHFATLVRAHESAIAFCRVAEAPEVSGTPFWDAYANCYGKFFAGSDFAVPALSLRAAEKYWVPYLELMQAIVRRDPIEVGVEQLRGLFVKRNQDKRFLAADAHQIEGTRNHPAKWDFRLEALLAMQQGGDPMTSRTSGPEGLGGECSKS